MTEDGFSTADVNLLSIQYERLVDIGKNYSDVAGVVEFQEKESQIAVRIKPGADVDKYRAAIEDAASAEDAVPVIFVETTVTRAQLDSLLEHSKWAGEYAEDVVQVLPNLLDETVTIYANAHFDELAQMAYEYSSIRPAMADAAGSDGIQLQDSRRADSNDFDAGFSLWLDPPPSPLTGDAWCTAGFAFGASQQWISTAEHCKEFGSGDRFYHNGSTQRARLSAGYLDEGIDVAMLAPLNGTSFGTWTWHGGRNTTTKYPVTGKLSTFLGVGGGVYVSGANGGLIYGTVTQPNILITPTGPGSDGIPRFSTIIDTVTGHPNDGSTQGGDSGSPVTRWNTSTPSGTDQLAVGIHWGGGVGTAAFTPLHRVEAASGFVVSLSSP